MSLRPADRYPSALDLANDVEQWLADEPVGAWPEPLSVRARRWISRHRTLVSTSAATFVVAMVSLVALQQEGLRAERAERKSAEKSAEVAALKANDLENKEKDRKAIDDYIHLAQTEWNDGNLNKARTQFTGALATIASDPRFESEYAYVKDVISKLDEQLAAQNAKAADAETLANFESLWQTAVFYSPNGPYEFLINHKDQKNGLEKARAAAAQALALFSLSEKTDPQQSFRKMLDSRTYDDFEKKQITDRCYELLLWLADAISRPLPGENMHEQANKALAILEQAKGVRGTVTQAYQRQRLEILAQSGQPDRDATLGNGLRPQEVDQRKINSQTEMDMLPITALDHFLAGKLVLERGREERTGLSQAINHFENALRLEPGYFWAQYMAALCYLSDERLDGPEQAQLAKVHLTACITQREQFPGMLVARAIINSKLKEYETADEDFRKVLDDSEADPRLRYTVFVNRAAMHRERSKEVSDIHACIEDLKQAIAILPDEFQAHHQLSAAYSDLRQFKTAEEHINKAIELAPRRHELYRQKAEILLQLDKKMEAVASLDKAIELTSLPGDYIAKGMILQLLGKQVEAMKVISEAPPNPESDLLVAGVLKELSAENALNAIKAYIHGGLADADPDILYGQSLLAARDRDYSKAIQDITEAMQLAQDESMLLRFQTLRGWLYLAKEDPHVAIDDFNAVIARDPAHGHAYLLRGIARSSLGDKNALKDADDGLRVLAQKTDRAYYAAARIYSIYAQQLEGVEKFPYAGRAMELLESALAATKEGRAKFYDEVLMKDPDLNWLTKYPKFPRREKS